MPDNQYSGSPESETQVVDVYAEPGQTSIFIVGLRNNQNDGPADLSSANVRVGLAKTRDLEAFVFDSDEGTVSIQQENVQDINGDLLAISAIYILLTSEQESEKRGKHQSYDLRVDEGSNISYHVKGRIYFNDRVTPPA